ncbi:hypothetical protein HOF92_01665 [bacterium]|jgi:Na+-transporting methylmalonyl-CoA/oxaloacetate decarboxylase gamma subunit|nr:hypothetical protein [bacterium]
MFLEGLKITILGMGTVFFFLCILVVSVILLGYFLGPDEDSPTEASDNDSLIPVVLAAAIARFKKSKNKNGRGA